MRAQATLLLNATVQSIRGTFSYLLVGCVSGHIPTNKIRSGGLLPLPAPAEQT